MNIVDTIEARIGENKTSFKTYTTYKTACGVGHRFGVEFARANRVEEPVSYIPVFLPNYGRWTLVFRQMDWMRKYNVGGYVGFFARSGFFSI